MTDYRDLKNSTLRNIGNKMCSVCKSRDCSIGDKYTLEENSNYQRYVCKRCVGATTSPLVRYHLKIGTINAAQVLASRHGSGCPSECVSRSTGVCSGARWANLRA